MSGNYDETDIEISTQKEPLKQDYELIKDKDVDKHFLRFLIMSLFWRYE